MISNNHQGHSFSLSTEPGNHFFTYFHPLYENAFDSISRVGLVDHSLMLFDIRLNHALAMEITLNSEFRYAKTDEYRKAYVLMLKLSNIWFCYEALLHACQSLHQLKSTKSKVDALDERVVSELDIKYEFSDVTLRFKGMSGRLVYEKKYRDDMQGYIDHLRTSATSREQKAYLLNVYNRFTNGDFFSIPEALSFAYAVRNQYVHAGESPDSGVQFLETKIAALAHSFDYMALLCLRLGELLIDRKLATANAPKLGGIPTDRR